MAVQISKKSMIQKLGMKVGQRIAILNKPKNLDLFIPKGMEIKSATGGQLDLILDFFESQSLLKKQLPKIKKCLEPKGAAWISYLKGGETDLSRDIIHDLVETVGLTAVSLISLNEEWSSMKIMHPKDQRR